MPGRGRLVLTRRGGVVLAGLGLLVLGLASWVAVERQGLGLEDLAAPLVPGPDPTPTPTVTATATPTSPPEVVPLRAAVTPRVPVDGRTAVGRDGSEALAEAVRALVDHAPVVVLADAAVVPQARGESWRLGVPVLPAELSGLDGLLDDLGTEVVVRVHPREPSGAGTADPSPTATGTPLPQVVGGRDVRPVPVDGTDVDRSSITDIEPGPPASRDRSAVLLPAGDPVTSWVEPLARAVGARLVPMVGPVVDDAEAIGQLRAHRDLPWVAVGARAGWQGRQPRLLPWDVEVVRGRRELPGGGYRLFPGRRLVALYGSPGTSSLGVLGEQPVDAAIERAREQAQQYADHVDEPVVPTLEIIATVATAEAGDVGDYSRRVPHDVIRPWVEAAARAGVYVVLDLQPGRTDFLSQARELEPFLRQPHVGLALDPEWRLRTDQVHLRQIGSVPVAEVQRVADWLADLTREHGLPQKLLLLHQFRASMLPDREQLDLPPELATVVQMDGQGAQETKMETWRAITTGPAPDGLRFGWKNFHDEDTTLRTPADTLAVDPSPVLVSYQ